jgi:hypothetical protein
MTPPVYYMIGIILTAIIVAVALRQSGMTVRRAVVLTSLAFLTLFFWPAVAVAFVMAIARGR